MTFHDGSNINCGPPTSTTLTSVTDGWAFMGWLATEAPVDNHREMALRFAHPLMDNAIRLRGADTIWC